MEGVFGDHDSLLREDENLKRMKLQRSVPRTCAAVLGWQVQGGCASKGRGRVKGLSNRTPVRDYQHVDKNE